MILGKSVKGQNSGKTIKRGNYRPFLIMACSSCMENDSLIDNQSVVSIILRSVANFVCFGAIVKPEHFAIKPWGWCKAKDSRFWSLKVICWSRGMNRDRKKVYSFCFPFIISHQIDSILIKCGGLCAQVNMRRQFVVLRCTWLQKFFSSRDMMTRYKLFLLSTLLCLFTEKYT